jgi:type III pantothenate kinase
MLLALDVRNGSVSVGFRDGGRWLAIKRLGAHAGKSPDEYAILLEAIARGAVEAAPVAPKVDAPVAPKVDGAWMSCVVPSIAPILREATASAFGVECALVGPGARTGVRIRTDNPSEVGSDLVCAAAAAHEIVGKACVVATFGTALVFSAVGKSGDFLGCAIAPGVGTAAESLRASAAQIPDVRIEPGAPALGRNTTQSVRAGIFEGYRGLAERLVRRQREEITAMGEAEDPQAVEVVGSGEDLGREILKSLGFERFVPELVLEGVAIIAERAVSR